MDEFANILLAEDDTSDYDFFVEALKKISFSYKLTRFKFRLSVVAVLKTSKPDIILEYTSKLLRRRRRQFSFISLVT